MPEKTLPAMMFRKQRETEPVRGADLYRSTLRGVDHGDAGMVVTDEHGNTENWGKDDTVIPIHSRYGGDVADRAASRLNALRSSDRGPFAGHSGAGGAPPPPVKRTTIIEEHAPSQDADVLADKYDQKKRLGY